MKAIIYAMGGPFPSELEKFEYAINMQLEEVKVYLITKDTKIFRGEKVE